MMLRKTANDPNEIPRRGVGDDGGGGIASASNGYGITRRRPSISDYGKPKETRRGMHPHLSPYFMDLDEFCQSTAHCDDTESCSNSSTENQRRRSVGGDSDSDPAGLFPTNGSGTHSRLFIPKALPHLEHTRPAFGKTPLSLSGQNHSAQFESHNKAPLAPPALLKTPLTLEASTRTGLHMPAVPVSTYSPTNNEPRTIASSSSFNATSFETQQCNSSSTADTETSFSSARKRAKRRPREYVYNPKPFKPKAVPSNRSSSPKDETYWDKRNKNNVAAKRSRENRRKKEIETVDKCSLLERENAELRERISTLEKQNAWLEGKLTKFLLP